MYILHKSQPTLRAVNYVIKHNDKEKLVIQSSKMYTDYEKIDKLDSAISEDQLRNFRE